MSVIYSSSIPENIKDEYTEYSNVDFVMTFKDQLLNLNSIRLEGDLDVKHDSSSLNSVANTDKNIVYDRLVGGHAFIESVQTEVGGSVVENLSEYARYVKMVGAASLSPSDMYNSVNVCELKCGDVQQTNMMMKGEVVETQPTVAVRNNPDFSIKPKFVLNAGTGRVPYSRTGAIRVSFNLARNFSALYGLDVSALTKYSLKNLRLVYTTVPDDGSASKLVPLRTKLNIKQSIQSGFANISTKVPAEVDSVSCSLQYQDEEQTAVNNNQQLQKIPSVSQVQFLFNDSTNKYMSFSLDNNEEIVSHFIESMIDSGTNTMSPNQLALNDGYGIGLRFGGDFIDLRNQKFNIQITSALTNTRAMIMYLYFHSIMSL